MRSIADPSATPRFVPLILSCAVWLTLTGCASTGPDNKPVEPGRIEQLKINVTGEHVKKGQLIAVIYSPELITAQKELLEALSLKDKYPALMDAAREKLRNWKLSDSQISDMEKSGKVTSTFNL